MLLLYPWPGSNFNSPRIEFIVNDKSKKHKGGGSGFMDYFLLFVSAEINKLAACATTIFPYLFFSSLCGLLSYKLTLVTLPVYRWNKTGSAEHLIIKITKKGRHVGVTE